MSDLKFEICKAKDCNNEFVASNSKYPNACSQICFQSMKKVDIKLKSLKSIKTVSDKRKIEEEKWVGVVLRNLPPDCNQEMITKNFKSTDHFTVIKADMPMTIKGQRCGLL